MGSGKRKLIAAAVVLGAVCCRMTGAYEVIVPESPSPAEQTAARELRDYLARGTTGVTVFGNDARIYLGDTSVAREAGIDCGSMEEENWVIKTLPPDRLIIGGGGRRGTLYGVYNFLEHEAGIRWWNPFDDFVPEPAPLVLGELEERGAPYFFMRNIYRNNQFPDDAGRWAARNRINQDGDSPITPAYGSELAFGAPYHVHTIAHADGYLPEEKYFQEHPEYFAVIGGERNGSQFKGQICFSHPDLPDMFIEKLKRNIVADEEKAHTRGTDAPRIYDISINDNTTFCECPRCQEALKTLRPSDLMLRFINRIADFLAEYRPGYYIQTAAYFSTLEPPLRERVRDNVIVRLCDTYSLRHEDITSDANRAFREILLGWEKVAKHLAVWEYGLTFDDSAGLPYPSEYTLAANKKFYREHGVMGLIIEREYPDVSDMYDLKTWLDAKLLETPDLPLPELLDDFYGKYYGPAASRVREYREKLRETAFRNHASIAYFSPGRKPFEYIDYTAMAAMQLLMDEAEQLAADSPQYASRVRRARFGLDLALGFSLREHLAASARDAGVADEAFQAAADAALRRARSAWRESAARLQHCGKVPLDMEQVFSGIDENRQNTPDGAEAGD